MKQEKVEREFDITVATSATGKNSLCGGQRIPGPFVVLSDVQAMLKKARKLGAPASARISTSNIFCGNDAGVSVTWTVKP